MRNKARGSVFGYVTGSELVHSTIIIIMILIIIIVSSDGNRRRQIRFAIPHGVEWDR